MVFSSLTFLCIFLPVVFIGHLLLPGIRAKNALLILASLFFYAYGEPVYVLLMIASTLINWGLGRAIGRRLGTGEAVGEKADTPASAPQTGDKTPATLTTPATAPATSKPRGLLVCAILVNLAFLGIFKYAALVAGTLGALFAIEAPFAHIALPIGISFYTFQALSYVIDIYRGQVAAQRSYARVLLYISFFPQLIAGPIIKYHEVEAQLAVRHVTVDGAARGLRRFATGLAKKVLIANTLGSVADAVYATPGGEINMALAWIGAIAYLLQIYFDFSGYSDMALGLARMFGFNFRENFEHPYISRSVQEFWRRWHISLSTWFKEYLYIPLGGNRKGRARTVLNKFLVFGLCGLWHGASWTFLLWGLFHGLFLLLEEYLPLKKLPRLLGWLYAMLVVCVGFVLFRADSLSQAGLMIQQMFTGFGGTYAAAAQAAFLIDPPIIAIFCLACLASTPVAGLARKWLAGRGKRLQTAARILSYAGALGLFVLSFLALAGSGYNPFIYFRF
ncbi:MAG: hypothetical protein LBO07_07580 [Coriobacteriales bacterium]|jgi:alginate O-acetyltransferase complex protein AlgI|nr:hypothetical protein [Coriobacteriales bacterium]